MYRVHTAYVHTANDSKLITPLKFVYDVPENALSHAVKNLPRCQHCQAFKFNFILRKEQTRQDCSRQLGSTSFVSVVY